MRSGNLYLLRFTCIRQIVRCVSQFFKNDWMLVTNAASQLMLKKCISSV